LIRVFRWRASKVNGEGTENKAAAARLSQIHVYDNAPHAFHADYRPSYRKEEAEDGWKRIAQAIAQGRG
jgi:dienelactone hydrolase